jgi:hypothetical protein
MVRDVSSPQPSGGRQPLERSSKVVVHIFQSYGWRDAVDVAQRLKDSLTQAGYEVWIDREHLRADDKHFSLELEQAIADSEVVVALLSPHSVRGAGDDVRSSICYNELRLADELQRPIVPVRVRKFVGPPPFLIIKYRRVDWLNWNQPQAYRKGLHEITEAIKHALAHGTLFDPDIAFQATNFTPQLQTAADSFTGREWLFKKVDTWLTDRNPCFLLEGVTGSGKTAMVAELVRRNSGGRVLAYHFCTPVQVTVDPASFVRSIAGMLAASIDAYAEELWNGKLASWLTAADPDTMLRQGVLAPLRNVSVDPSCCIVVDALDEAVGLGDRVSVPALLAGALEEFPRWLKLFVTSRPHQRVQRLFRQAETCVLGEGNDNHFRDLLAFINSKLTEPALGDPLDPAQCDHTAAQISASAAGNFQYAQSVLDALATGEISATTRLPPKLEDLYYLRAQRRFPDPSNYRLARLVLSLLLAAREPLSLPALKASTDLDFDTELAPTLEAISCFTESSANGWRIAHKSIADWLISAGAGEFTIDPTPGQQRLLEYCEAWATHQETYALKHVVAHLLDAGQVADALGAVQQGLFEQRLRQLGEPRLDAEDSRNLTASLIADDDAKGIVALAKTANLWQRDGVAAALQAAPTDKLPFIDRVVGALLAVSA